jgi:hypothetical protein
MRARNLLKVVSGVRMEACIFFYCLFALLALSSLKFAGAALTVLIVAKE